MIRPMTTILIFGAAVRPDGTPSTALRRRVEAALAAARNEPCTTFIPSGSVGRHGPSEASVMAALLAKEGVSSDRIRLEETASDTWSSVRAFHRMARERPFEPPILVATSAYHQPRCLALLCLVGIAARPCPMPPGPAATAWRKRWYWRLREVFAFPYDVSLAIWSRLTGGL